MIATASQWRLHIEVRFCFCFFLQSHPSAFTVVYYHLKTDRSRTSRGNYLRYCSGTTEQSYDINASIRGYDRKKIFINIPASSLRNIGTWRLPRKRDARTFISFIPFGHEEVEEDEYVSLTRVSSPSIGRTIVASPTVIIRVRSVCV